MLLCMLVMFAASSPRPLLLEYSDRGQVAMEKLTLPCFLHALSRSFS